MRGIYTKGKIQYHTPRYNSLSGGSWKTGWSGVKSTGGEIIEYDVVSDIDLVEGEWYEFKLENNIAHIKQKK